jgi:hypothetical protein
MIDSVTATRSQIFNIGDVPSLRQTSAKEKPAKSREIRMSISSLSSLGSVANLERTVAKWSDENAKAESNLLILPSQTEPT